MRNRTREDMTMTDPLKPWLHELRHFGDPRKFWQWKTGQVDYVARLGLTGRDVPELIEIARQWTREPAWPADRDDMSPYAPIHAWRALAQLRAPAAVEPLLEMLDALDARGDDWYPQEFPKVFAFAGPPALDALTRYLADNTHGDFPRACAACGIKLLAARHPATRDRGAAALIETLSHYRGNGPALNAFLIRYLREMDAADQAGGLIELAIATGRADPDILGM